MSGAGCGVPRVCACTQTPGRRSSDTALPLLRAGPVNAAMSDRGAPLMCNAPRNGQGGLGAKKPPRWSAERRASPGAQTVKASLRGDARTYVTGPLTKRVPTHPSAFRRSASLTLREGDWQTSEEICLARRMMRAWQLAPPSFRDASAARGPGIHTPQPWLWIPGSPLSRRPGMTSNYRTAGSVFASH